MIKKKAFTLIELMIAITIIVILTMAAYAPYNYYQNKAKLKVATREISQLLSESRNMAINWAVSNSWNVSIGVYFDSSIVNNNKIRIFSYPHDIDNLSIVPIEWADIKLIKTYVLQKWIQIDDVESKNNFLFFYSSISWELIYYNWDWWVRNTILDDNIAIHLSFKGATTKNLQRTINYFTSTSLIDY